MKHLKIKQLQNKKKKLNKKFLNNMYENELILQFNKIIKKHKDDLKK